VRVICSHCLANRPEIESPYLFPLYVCKQATIHAQEAIYCKKGLPQEKLEFPFYLREQKEKERSRSTSNAEPEKIEENNTEG
jgi:hypothetical protein